MCHAAESLLGGTVVILFGTNAVSYGCEDFHCGLRGITRDALKRLQFRTAGMEFATEMIAVAKKAGLRIGQVPVSLRKCRFEHRSKVRIVRDGVRHLEYILGG